MEVIVTRKRRIKNTIESKAVLPQSPGVGLAAHSEANGSSRGGSETSSRTGSGVNSLEGSPKCTRRERDRSAGGSNYSDSSRSVDSDSRAAFVGEVAAHAAKSVPRVW